MWLQLSNGNISHAIVFRSLFENAIRTATIHKSVDVRRNEYDFIFVVTSDRERSPKESSPIPTWARFPPKLDVFQGFEDRRVRPLRIFRTRRFYPVVLSFFFIYLFIYLFSIRNRAWLHRTRSGKLEGGGCFRIWRDKRWTGNGWSISNFLIISDTYTY